VKRGSGAVIPLLSFEGVGFDGTVLADLALYLAGALLTVWLIRRWRPTLSWRAGMGYVALAAAFVGPALFTTGYQVNTEVAYRIGPWRQTIEEPPDIGNGLLQDVILQMVPFRVMVRERWLAGEPPLWAHELGTGQPLLGDAQSAPLYPHHLMALPVPAIRGMTLAVAWQLLLALLTMHALVAWLMGPEARGGPGAALAAVSFAFCTFNVAWLYYPMGATAVWVPAVVLGLVTVAAGVKRSFGALVLCGTFAALAGHPETLAHIGVLSVVVAAVLWWRRPAVGRGVFVRRLAGAAVVSFCLAAPFLLPVLETLEQSERMVILDELKAAGTHTRRGVTPIETVAPGVVDPFFYGTPRASNYSGPGNWNEAMSLYGGLLPLVFAFWGAWVYGGRLAWIVFAAVLTLLGGAGYGPVRWFLESLPVLENGAHHRLRLLWLMGLAVAAGWALERWTATPRPEPPSPADPPNPSDSPTSPPRSWPLELAAGLAAVVWTLLVLLPPGNPAKPPTFHQELWWYTGLAVLAVFVVAVVVLARRGFSVAPRWLAWLVVGMTIFEMGLMGIDYNPLGRAELDLATNGVSRVPGVVLELQERQASGPPFRVLAEGYDMVANLHGVHGLWQPRFNDPASPGLASRFAALRLSGEYRVGHVPAEMPDTYDPRLHEYLGIRWVMVPRGRRLPAPWHAGPRRGGIWMWENRRALPLFFFPRRVGVAPDARAAYERALELEDFAARAIALRNHPGEQRGEVTVTAAPHDGFDLTIDSPTGGLVASSVSWAPGWRLWWGGEAHDTEIVNGGFLGFEVPSGETVATLRYVPRTWWPAWGLFGLGLLGWGAAGWRRHVSVRSHGTSAS
jgi:hypothetical protein